MERSVSHQLSFSLSLSSYSLLNSYALTNCNPYSEKTNLAPFYRSICFNNVWVFFQLNASRNPSSSDVSNEKIRLTWSISVIFQFISGVNWYSIHLYVSISIPKKYFVEEDVDSSFKARWISHLVLWFQRQKKSVFLFLNYSFIYLIIQFLQKKTLVHNLCFCFYNKKLFKQIDLHL